MCEVHYLNLSRCIQGSCCFTFGHSSWSCRKENVEREESKASQKGGPSGPQNVEDPAVLGMPGSLGSFRVDRLKKGNSSEVLRSRGGGDSHGSRSRVAHNLTTEDARTMSPWTS